MLRPARPEFRRNTQKHNACTTYISLQDTFKVSLLRMCGPKFCSMKTEDRAGAVPSFSSAVSRVHNLIDCGLVTRARVRLVSKYALPDNRGFEPRSSPPSGQAARSLNDSHRPRQWVTKNLSEDARDSRLHGLLRLHMRTRRPGSRSWSDTCLIRQCWHPFRSGTDVALQHISPLP